MIPTIIEPNIFATTFFVGLVTEALAAERMNKPILFLIIGQWLIVAGVAGWGILNLGDIYTLVIVLIGAPQISRIVRRIIALIIVWQEVDNAAQPYLYGR